MTVYGFKPALLRAELEFTLQDSVLTGPDWALDLRDVTAVSYAETSVRYVTNRYLELDANGQTRRVSQNIDTGAEAAREPFSELVVAILRDVHALYPDMQVSYGMRGNARLGMFIVGVLSLGVGAGLPIAALATGVSGDRLLAALVPSLLLVLLGMGFGWGNRPWQAPPSVSLAKLIHSLDQRQTANDTPTPPAD
jgi:hypothetical protein